MTKGNFNLRGDAEWGKGCYMDIAVVRVRTWKGEREKGEKVKGRKQKKKPESE